ncbi:type II toxin-antitoxin system death-on-curing family toxin [Pelagibius litoralis]|uniref:Type II toxin-antitoxin system death-on-curing family toxin n=1 Tax=Pelagibius litoralis TaxID=374515 RepID=A0A967K7I1_9PROT|nr:type II toxin-antitoxin system death-on-curing family toxin [Pelagibius litoralis]NIA69853.1 type II toxin-antitoxin system death-on-curing family toxin [Pelagibius litoralis]
MDRRWLTIAMAMAFHRESIARFGGSDGVRDAGLLESALARPRNRAAYEEDVSFFALAAEYCLGIVRNHPFVDGNKRSGILAGAVFLTLNGYDFEPEETAIVHMILALAAGEVDGATLARWFEESSRPRSNV